MFMGAVTLYCTKTALQYIALFPMITMAPLAAMDAVGVVLDCQLRDCYYPCPFWWELLVLAYSLQWFGACVTWHSVTCAIWRSMS